MSDSSVKERFEAICDGHTGYFHIMKANTVVTYGYTHRTRKAGTIDLALTIPYQKGSADKTEE